MDPSDPSGKCFDLDLKDYIPKVVRPTVLKCFGAQLLGMNSDGCFKPEAVDQSHGKRSFCRPYEPENSLNRGVPKFRSRGVPKFRFYILVYLVFQLPVVGKYCKLLRCPNYVHWWCMFLKIKMVAYIHLFVKKIRSVWRSPQAGVFYTGLDYHALMQIYLF